MWTCQWDAAQAAEEKVFKMKLTHPFVFKSSRVYNFLAQTAESKSAYNAPSLLV